MAEVIDLASDLIQRESLSPDDAGCQDIINTHLDALSFNIVDHSRNNTSNTWAEKDFGEGPTLVFAGHTDVVKPGSLEDWSMNGVRINPFDLTELDGQIYGRGVADMKGSLAAMVVATQEFLTEHKPEELRGRLAFLITSDEEADRTDGTQVVIEELRREDQTIDYAIVGEASSVEKVGDRIYVARRGSFHLKELVINGLVGHVAKDNGIDAGEIAFRLQSHAAMTTWDDDPDPRFPGTSFKSWTIDGGFELENMVSGRAVIRANWRNNPASSGDSIRSLFERIADETYDVVAKERMPNGDRFEYTWSLSGEPYATPSNSPFVKLVSSAVKEMTGLVPELSGGGGTSDGGVIAALGAHVVELGVQGAGIHEANEHIPVDALEKLKDSYKKILEKTLVTEVS
ncbi:MAG: succinyl-diaminopimelate desuccinylase [Candidatus Saccharibacteria bacterium]|nr:succinyl-diaminopimelate desuccinylase [Candidatus Saccharibacteria bacterium]